MERSPGDIIRFWRKKRQLSQMVLGLIARARNALLVAAGHAPSYRELDLSADEAAQSAEWILPD